MRVKEALTQRAQLCFFRARVVCSFGQDDTRELVLFIGRAYFPSLSTQLFPSPPKKVAILQMFFFLSTVGDFFQHDYKYTLFLARWGRGEREFSLHCSTSQAGNHHLEAVSFSALLVTTSGSHPNTQTSTLLASVFRVRSSTRIPNTARVYSSNSRVTAAGPSPWATTR